MDAINRRGGDATLLVLPDDAINRRGGDATLLVLPDMGIRGNTHAPFADTNNLEVARIMEEWLHKKGLDGSGMPHKGPGPAKTSQVTIPLQQ